MVITSLSDYVKQVTEKVSTTDDPRELVETILPLKEELLQIPDLIPDTFMTPVEGAAYTRNLLYADPKGRFVVMALVWRPQAETPPHDHRSWGVVGGYSNTMAVVNFAEPAGSEEPLKPIGEGSLPPGHATAVLPPRKCNLHVMKNPSQDVAITIHTYGDPADSCRCYCPNTGREEDVALDFHARLSWE